MIHDAIVSVTCDNEHCTESIDIQPAYTYNNYSGTSGQYNTEDSAIEKQVESEGWLVQDGKHFCSEECASD